MHTGIHAGLVYAREADPAEGRYELVGDPVNTAARLCAAAGNDEILASESALGGVEPFFETRAVEPLRLKGKGKPVPVYRVLGRTGVATRFEARARRGLTTFIGRSREIAALDGALAAVLSGKVRVLEVRGDAGVGKTRLLEEFRRRLEQPELRTFAGHCESYGNIAPLQPFLQILRQAFGLKADTPREASARRVEAELAALDRRLLRQLPALLQALSLGAPVKQESEDGSLSNAFVQWITALSERGPVVLTLDDWQWADDASRQLLADLVAGLSREARRVLVVTCARTGKVMAPVSGESGFIELMPFDTDEVDAMMRALMPTALDLETTGAMKERAGGNALFLEELCQALSRDGVELDLGREKSVPSTIHGLIQARVQRLPPALSLVSQAAAVIGSEFEEWLLSRIVGPDGLAQALDSLAENDLVYAGYSSGLYRFKHGITREVVYNSVKLGERRRLHGAIARAIEDCFGESGALERSEALAAHWAGAAEPERASMYAELAGDKAAAASSLDCARQQYGAAMLELDRISTSAPTRRRWLEIAWKWAAACVFSPAPEQVGLLERALEFAVKLDDPEAIARSHYWLSWIHYALGDAKSASSHARAALAIAEHTGSFKLVAQLLANLGHVHAASAECTQALAMLERALELKRTQVKTHFLRAVPVGFAYALGVEALVQGYQGDFQESAATMETALRAVRGAEHAVEASLMGLRGMIEVWQGRYGDCVQTASVSRLRAERMSGPYVFATSEALGSFARAMLGADPAALGELGRVVSWLDERGMRLFLSFWCACLAEALFAAGDDEGAARAAGRALERAEAGDRLGEVPAYRVRARLAARERDIERAKSELESGRRGRGLPRVAARAPADAAHAGRAAPRRKGRQGGARPRGHAARGVPRARDARVRRARQALPHALNEIDSGTSSLSSCSWSSVTASASMTPMAASLPGQ